MADDVVAEVKSRIDIVDLIGGYVPLRKAGKNYLGLCPFHSEKTPSFHVSPERQTYHCFGCGKGGDAFSFVMEVEGLTFPEALEQLAHRVGVIVPQRDSRRKVGLRDVLDESLAFFRSALALPSGEVGRAYLKRRNLGPTQWEAFELGWAPRSWDGLTRHLEKKQFAARLLDESGVTVEGKKGRYDRFRGRVIFPIRDVTGKLIAFGGRLVDGEGAKYINSPENELYSKRRSLYLIDKARRAIVERRRSILVEGYMDAIRLHLAGFTETVASLGTALTEDQAAILGRLADRCYICYDADLSGQEATLKGMYLLQRSGLDVHVVTLPSAKDPDEFLQQEDGPEAFGKALAEAKPLLAYHLALRRKAFRDRQRRRGAVEELLEGLLSLPLLEIASYLPEIASAMAVTPRQLQEVLEKRRKSLSLVETSRERGGREIGSLSFPGREEGICPLSDVPIHEGDQKRADPWEEILCWLLWNDESLRERADLSTVLPLLRDPLASSIICALLGGETPDELTVRWLQAGETRAQALLASGGDRCERLPRDGSLWTLALRELESRRLKEEYERLKIRMTANEASASDVVRYYELAGKLKGGKVT